MTILLNGFIRNDLLDHTHAMKKILLN